LDAKLAARNASGRRSRAGPQAAAALIGLAALEAVFVAMRRLGDLKLHVVETIALGLAAGVIYLGILYALERSREAPATFWLILTGALLFRLTLVPLEPSLSTDIHRYRWDGHVQQAGWNPYAVAPNDPRLAALRDAHWLGMPGRELPTIYPPLAELVYRLAWRVLPGPVGFKLPFLLADLLVVCLLAVWMRTTGGRNFQLAIYAWNPLVVVEFAASGHNDALAVAGVVAAIVIIRRHEKESTPLRGGAASTLALAAGALVKAFPAVLLPLWLRRTSWRNAVWAAALAGACAWPFRTAWPRMPQTLVYYESRWQNYNASLYSVIAWFSGSRELAAGLGVGVVAGLAIWAAARRMDVARAAYLLIGAILMLAPNGYSWYFTWIVPILCFLPSLGSRTAWLLLTVLEFLSYNVLIDYQATGRWQFDPLLEWLTYGPFYALLVWQALREARRSRDAG
jgi:alpha-1,6-mannosyltransferase